MNLKLKSALGVAAIVFGAQAVAQVTFYEGEGFRGRAFIESDLGHGLGAEQDGSDAECALEFEVHVMVSG